MKPDLIFINGYPAASFPSGESLHDIMFINGYPYSCASGKFPILLTRIYEDRKLVGYECSRCGGKEYF